jgi:hypothetical protein
VCKVLGAAPSAASTVYNIYRTTCSNSCALHFQNKLLYLLCTTLPEQLPPPITVRQTSSTTTRSNYRAQNFQYNYPLQLLSTKLPEQLPAPVTEHKTSSTTTLYKVCAQHFQNNYPPQLLSTKLP